MKITRASRLLICGVVTAGALLGAAPVAHADSWHLYLDGPKQENKRGYSKQAPMSKADVIATGGGGWDLTEHAWFENENGTVLAEATGPGNSLITAQIARRNAYAGCKWTSQLYSGDGETGMSCRYYGGAPIGGRVGSGPSGGVLAHDGRVARLARGVDLAGLGGVGLRAGSLRFAGRADGVTYFRGSNLAGHSCLVGWWAGQGFSASSCEIGTRLSQSQPRRLQLAVRGQERRAVTLRNDGTLVR